MALDYNPSFHILISLIEIWTPSSEDSVDYSEKGDPNDVRLIAECESIEVVESYRQLIGTAYVKFPRGTVVKKTITEARKSGLYTYNSQTRQEEEHYDSQVTASVQDHGVIYETRVDSKKAELNDFNIGDRIKISLGYTIDPKIAALTRRDSQGKSIFNDKNYLSKYRSYLKKVFDGYIVKISVDTPIELECENWASNLRRITCPDKEYKSATVNTLLGSDAKQENLLEGTGLTLDTNSAECKFSLGKVKLTSDMLVSDEIMRWSDFGIYAFVRELNNKPVLTVCRAYFSNPGKDSILNVIRTHKYGNQKFYSEIQFAYDVADNGLSLMDTDKNFMAVEASGIDAKEKSLHVTVRLNPEWKDGDSEDTKYLYLNVTEETKKQKKRKAKKKAKGVVAVGQKRTKRWKMKDFTTVKFHSKKVPTTIEELKKEAVKYFEGYNLNGIEGSLTLFGPHVGRDPLETADLIYLRDLRQTGKNGVYLIDEVVTTFGIHGYRQKLKLPYCLWRGQNSSKYEQQVVEDEPETPSKPAGRRSRKRRRRRH